MTLLELRGVSRGFDVGGETVQALRDVDLRIDRGEFVAIVGPSGGGKTTLLSILGGLDVPDVGDYLIEGKPVPAQEGPALAALRARMFGFVFQGFHLLEQRPAIDSVALGMLYQGVPAGERRIRAQEAAARVGMGDRLGQRTATLSGGQRQRLAIARAIATESSVLLADEPTGNLDSDTGGRVMEQLRRLHAEGVTVVVVTHSAEVAAAAQRVLRIVDGRVTELSMSAHPALPTTPESSKTSHDSAPSRPGSRFADTIHDALASLRSRLRQSLALAGTVGLAIALLVTTLGLMDSTRAQVTTTFDAHANREVTVTWPLWADDSPASDALGAATALAGVDVAAVITAFPEQPVGNLRDDPKVVSVHEARGDLATGAGAKITWASGQRLAPTDALIGRALAEQLELGPLVAGPVITVAGTRYTVRGVVEAAVRLPMLSGEVIVGIAPAQLEASQRSLLVRTRSGAARQVGNQLPVALDAYDPGRFDVQVPSDPRTLRAEVETGVQAALIAFTAVSALIALLTLMNSIGAAVTARRAELGLRRALGADSNRLAGLVVAESAIVGAAGGLAGLVAGLVGILAFTIAQRWVPVFDVRLAPLAILGGVLVGAAASVLGAIRAARVRPADALRQ
ncbi:macrolide transport system ATP-binding/permease protein [Microbacterium sp. W4I4]|uniref:ABC transporter ATP-binding protein/permease n=1 Tax=Microbacterium sp. W4I4 TaxID=3042295 RepID=UPI002784B51F|nr:ATP-binding cassette domain-containing protein [Microbacterium sp. W4I4]MDQ0613553.1 macrolide transport system ATP-binding/permease protein [Microbacterium sp. W4I4]